MKKYLCVFIGFIIFLFGGCLKRSNETLESSTAENVNNISNINSTNLSETLDGLAEKYENHEIKKYEINIQYPKIAGMSDEEQQDKLNDFIRTNIWEQSVQSMIDSYNKNSEFIISEKDIQLSLKSRITLQTKDIVSICYIGNSFITGSAHPINRFEGITVNVKDLEVCELSDYITIDKNTAKKILNSNNIYSGDMLEEDSHANTSSYLIKEFQSLWDEESLIALLNNPENKQAFYLTPDSIWVQIPISHLHGDYVMVEIPN